MGKLTHSSFNSRRTMPDALAQVIRDVKADVLVLSYNDEAWLTLDQLTAMCDARGHVAVLGFPHSRYVGARIGIHNPRGEKVGTVSHTRNLEYVLVAGARADVARSVAEFAAFRVV